MKTFNVEMQTGCETFTIVTVTANTQKEAWAMAMKQQRGVVVAIEEVQFPTQEEFEAFFSTY